MGLKTSGVGHFMIPTAPAAGTSVTSGAANTFTTTPVQLIASTTAALLITGIHVEAAAASAATYKAVQLMVGGSGSETVIDQALVPLSTGSTVALGYRQIYPPIPVAASARISAKTADSVGAQATLITLECIAQSNVVDDGVAQTSNVTQWNSTNVSTPATAGIPDVNVKNMNNVAATPITTIKAVQGLTTADTITAYTGNTPQTGDAYARLGAPVGASHSADVAAVKTDTAAIKIQTDKLVFTVAGYLDVNAYKWVGGTIPAVNVTGVPLVDLKYVLGTISPAAAGSVRADAVTGAVGSVTGAVGSVTGAVGSVTGAVGSVTGNVGGNVVGSVASVTARVTANTDQLAGQTVTAAAGVTFPSSVASPTNITAGVITTATNVTNVNGLAAGVITATSIAADAITDAKVASDVTIASVTGAVGSVTGNVGGSVASVVGAVGSVTGNVGGSVASVSGAVGSVTAAVTVGTNNDKTGYALSAAGVQAIWDALASALTTVGSVGKRIADFLTGDAYARIGAAGAGLTALGDTRIANLDAAVSTRSTYAGADTSGTTTLLSRLSSTRATALDNLDAAVSTRSTYAGGDTSGTTTLLSRLSSARATALDFLDAAITSRLASASYTAPPTAAANASAVRTELAVELGRIDAATSSRLAATSYTVPDNTSIVAIKAKTDGLAFTVAGKVDANVKAVNDTALTGTGAASDLWRPA
jgi:hypothetical protein